MRASIMKRILACEGGNEAEDDGQYVIACRTQNVKGNGGKPNENFQHSEIGNSGGERRKS